MDGKQVGLVPSNFVERVNEGNTLLIVGLHYMHNLTMSLLPVIGEVTRRRHKLSKRRGRLHHIDEEEENVSEKSTTGKTILKY